MSEPFHIVVKRESVKGDLVQGTLYLNGTPLGKTYENKKFKISANDYRGLLRYRSQHHFVQASHGTMGHRGDFLIEIAGVKGRSNLLFHTGNKPSHSQGCVLLGPIKSIAEKDGDISYMVDQDSPLRKLRLMFYGSDEPDSSPDKNISISIIDPDEIKLP
jgi:Family of unknown function (DUF5675)